MLVEQSIDVAKKAVSFTAEAMSDVDEEGLARSVDVADSLIRLNQSFQSNEEIKTVSEQDGLLAGFVLIQAGNRLYWIQEILRFAQNRDREKLIILLRLFTKGKVIDISAYPDLENWIVNGIGVSAPILELATKK